MDGQQTTFSVAVLAFHGNAEDTVRWVSEALAVSDEEAAGIVARAPVRVKRGIGAAETKQLASALRALGADIAIRNDQTGSEKTYIAVPEAVSDEEPPSVLRPGVPSSGGRVRAVVSPRLAVQAAPDPEPATIEESAPEPAAIEEASPSDEGGEEAEAEPEADESLILTPSDDGPPAPRESDGGTATPSSKRAKIVPFSEYIPPAVVKRVAAPPAEGEADAEPTSASPGRPTQPSLEKCAGCGRFFEKGGKCSVCGWSNAAKKRSCIKCGKDVVLAGSLSPVILAGSLGLGAAAGIGVSIFLSPPMGLALAVLTVGVILLFDGTKLHYRCVGCKRSTDAKGLVPIEKQRLARRRTQWLGAGIACMVLGLGTGAFGAGGRTRGGMAIDSFGLVYRTFLPRTHAVAEFKNVALQSEFGAAHMYSRVATNYKNPLHTLALAEIAIDRGLSPVIDDDALDRLAQVQIDKIFPGATVSGSTPILVKGTPGPSHEMAFEGMSGNIKAVGRARASLFEVHEVVLVLYASSAPDGAKDATGIEYLNSFVAEQVKGE